MKAFVRRLHISSLRFSAFYTLRNPGRLRFHATFGSDIGHWDVPLMEEVLE